MVFIEILDAKLELKCGLVNVFTYVNIFAFTSISQLKHMSQPRSMHSMVFQVFFAAGEMILALTAYFILSWRWLLLVSCAPLMIFIL